MYGNCRREYFIAFNAEIKAGKKRSLKIALNHRLKLNAYSQTCTHSRTTTNTTVDNRWQCTHSFNANIFTNNKQWRVNQIHGKCAVLQLNVEFTILPHHFSLWTYLRRYKEYIRHPCWLNGSADRWRYNRHCMGNSLRGIRLLHCLPLRA